MKSKLTHFERQVIHSQELMRNRMKKREHKECRLVKAATCGALALWVLFTLVMYILR